MTDSEDLLPASLQPWNRTAPDSKSFATALSRIYAERGHFRHLTEPQLRAEIATKALSGVTSPSESDVDEQDAKDATGASISRADQLAQARRDAIEHVASAQNEALLALDFVSLLLSKDVKQAEATISPILKQSVQPGTLGIDMWAGMTPDVKQEETDRLLARGKRMQSLTQSADALMAAGDRLKATVDRERKYWGQILQVRESGRSICRMPRERGVLGVRYGFAESQGEFARRGLAALRMGGEGDVVLDRGLGIQAKALRVRILQDGVVVGESSTKTAHLAEEDVQTTVEPRIRSARDSLFEEELWHEAMRESRLLGGYGVRMNGSAISVPLSYIDSQTSGTSGTSSTVEIDLVAEQDDDDNDTETPSILANGIATALRLLLSHTHRTRLGQRSQIPPPMTKIKADKHIAEIIRPLISGLHHQSAVNELTKHVSTISSLLLKAGIQSTQASDNALTSKLASSASATTLLSAFCEPYTSELKLSISFPTPGSDEPALVDISIKVTTYVSPPTSRGTTFVFSSPGLPLFNRTTSSLSVLEDHLYAALQYALTEATGKWFPTLDSKPLTGKVERPLLGRKAGLDEISLQMARDEKGSSLVLQAGSEEVIWGLDGGETRNYDDVMRDIVAEVDGTQDTSMSNTADSQ